MPSSDMERIGQPFKAVVPAHSTSCLRRLGQALCLPFIFFTLLYLLPIPLHPGSYLRLKALKPQVVGPSAILQPEPLLDDLEKGRWVPRREPLNLTTAYGGRYASVEMVTFEWPCKGICVGQELKEAKEERARRIADYVWEGAGAVDEALNGTAILKRLLESTGGLVIVGDETQEQLFDFFAAVLPSDLILSTSNASSSKQTRTSDVGSYFSKALHLHVSSPLAKTLLSATKTSPARLSRPVLTWIRDDLLLTRDEALEIVAEVSNMDPSHPELAAPKIKNIHFGDWATRVEHQALSPLILPNGQKWFGNKNTTVVVSSGSRWTKEHLLGFSQGELTHGFAHGSEHALEHLIKLPRTQYLYRPYISAHPDCWTNTVPLNNTPTGSQAEVMNKMWLHGLMDAQDRLMLEGPRPRGYLPVYERSAMRADAHRLLDADCERLAGPSVLEEWAKWIWRDMMQA